jgi:hypothetical protein
MPLQFSGVQFGDLTGAPSALTIEDLSDVNVTSIMDGQYLRYDSGTMQWENTYLDADIYSFLSTNLSGDNGVDVAFTAGPNTAVISLDLTASGDASGTVTEGDLSLTLATVNSSPQTDTFRKITVNDKGLVTATSAVASSDITALVDDVYVNVSGDDMTGNLTVLNATITQKTSAATTRLITAIGDGAFAGFDARGFGTGFGPLSVQRMARGTEADPTALLTGDTMGVDIWQGWDGTAFVDGARFQARTGSNWSGTNRETFVDVLAANVDSTTLSLQARFRNGQIRATNGIEGAPSFTADGDLDTGIYFPADNHLAIATGATERLRIAASGALGLSGANYGTAGQVMQSNGSSLAPTWSSSPTLDGITYSNLAAVATATLTTSTTTANQVVDTFALATFRSAKYQIQATSGSAYQMTEINLIHNGTTVFLTEYGTVLTGANLASFDSDVSGANIRLLVTPVNAVTTIRVVRTAINV